MLPCLHLPALFHRRHPAAAGLRRIGWKFALDDDPCRLFSGFRGEHGLHEFALTYQPDTRLLFLGTELPFRPPADRRGAVLETLALLNDRLLRGTFELSREDGSIRFRDATFLPSRRLDRATAEQFVIGALFIVDATVPLWQDVIVRGRPPAEALALLPVAEAA